MTEAIALLEEAIAAMEAILPHRNNKKLVFDRTFSLSHLQGTGDHTYFVKFGASGAILLHTVYRDALQDVSLMTKEVMRRLDEEYHTYHEENARKTYPLAFLGVGDIEAFVDYLGSWTDLEPSQQHTLKMLSESLPKNKGTLLSYLVYLRDIKETLL